MEDRQVAPAPIDGSLGGQFDRQLDVIEAAVDVGDLATARRHLTAMRRSFVAHRERPDRAPSTMAGGVALTGQERATLRLLPDGSLSQKDIAGALGVTRNTVKTHLKSLYLKLGVHCRAEAINRAREVGLLPRPFTLVPPPGRDDLVDVA